MSKPSAQGSSCRRRRRITAGRSLWAAALVLLVGAMVLCDRLGVFGRAPKPDFQKYHDRTFRVVRVFDGDTIAVDIPDGEYDTTRIRFWGVDTPEVYHYHDPEAPPDHFGPEASAFVRDLLTGGRVRLELVPWRTRGIHGRLLAYVYLEDGRMLNLLLVEKGYGYADPRFDHPLKEEFIEAQEQARQAGRGLWAEATDDDLPDYYKGRLDLPAAAE